MPKRVTVNLFGARGQRSVEVTTRGGFPARHIKVSGTSQIAGNKPVREAPAPLGDPDRVRVCYIERYSLKKKPIYTGEAFPQLEERCQTYADTHRVVVHLHTATSFKIFKPTPKPKQTDLRALLAEVDAIMTGDA